MTVENIIPKLIEITVGITYCACELVSNNIGSSPAAVVKEVKIIALNLAAPDSRISASRLLLTLK